MVSRALLVLLLVVLLALLLACAAGAARAMPAAAVTGGAVGDPAHVAEFKKYSQRMKNAGYDMTQYNAWIDRAAAAAP